MMLENAALLCFAAVTFDGEYKCVQCLDVKIASEDSQTGVMTSEEI
jgi:hypothetical protein